MYAMTSSLQIQLLLLKLCASLWHILWWLSTGKDSKASGVEVSFFDILSTVKSVSQGQIE